MEGKWKGQIVDFCGVCVCIESLLGSVGDCRFLEMSLLWWDFVGGEKSDLYAFLNEKTWLLANTSYCFIRRTILWLFYVIFFA